MKIYAFNIILAFSTLFSSCSEANNGTQAISFNTSNSISMDGSDTTGLEKATFAGGCFWCTEAFFERLKGVERVVSGYTGGESANPTYREVSSGTSGHAEAVQLYFDPQIITYQELLEVFFATHDPTTMNRQGPDVGEQYRSVIFYHSPEQQQQAQQYIKNLEGASAFLKQIVTKVEPMEAFYEAEEEHQDFNQKNPNNRYMEQVAEPKMKKFEERFKDKIKE